MTDIVNLRYHRVTTYTDLPRNLADLLTCVSDARRKVKRAKKLDTCVRYYAFFLRWYHNYRGMTVGLWSRSEWYVRRHGRECDLSRLKAIDQHFGAADEHVKGPHPWLSLPNLEAFRFNASRVLEAIEHALSEAARIVAEIDRGAPLVTGDAGDVITIREAVQ